jgi:hypothetical protein
LAIESPAKNPAKVAGGHLGARRRWGEPRILRLDQLTSQQRHLVLTLLEVTRDYETAARVSETPRTATEARHGPANPTHQD